MIFEQESIPFQILDVFYFDQQNLNLHNFKRNFDALSFRIEADTIIKYKENEIEFKDHSIGFFPAATDYIRTTKRDKMIVVHFKTFNYHTSEIQKFVPEDFKKYQALFENILNCWNKKADSYKHEAASLLNLIFAELYKDNKKTYASDAKIGLSIKYIEENCLNKDFSLKTAAKKSFMSDTYFRKLFKQKFNISPKQYVINHRIKYAASLIIAGYHTLEEISSLCGYNDYKHFSVEFKKVMGISPSKYVYDYDFENNKTIAPI